MRTECDAWRMIFGHDKLDAEIHDDDLGQEPTTFDQLLTFPSFVRSERRLLTFTSIFLYT